MARLVGAFDPGAWTGVVLMEEPGVGFGLRAAVERGVERADGDDFYYLVHEIGPNAPDGSYARVAFDLDLPFGRKDETPVLERATRSPGLIVEWGLDGAGGVLLRFAAHFEGTLELRGYFPWDWSGTWAFGAGVLRAVLSGGPAVGGVVTDPPTTWSLTSDNAAVCRFPVHPESLICVRATLAPEGRASGGLRAPVPGETEAHLTTAARRYAAHRPTGQGRAYQLLTAMSNSLHWMASLQPELGRRYLPAGRRWIFPRPGAGRDHWTIFCWDSFFNALELAVESPELARDMLAAVLGCQYENGNLPNWRGRFGGTPDRSQPPVGAFAVLSYYLRTGDREFLEWAYPYLERWSAWWRAPKNGRPRRDGNRDGLFEWGADLNLESASPPPWEQHATPRQKAAWESGQDDLPNWDHATWDDEGQTLAIAPVDLNAYLVLDFECLAAIARHLGRGEQAVAYDRMRRALCDRMNALLWNEAVGMYLDRHWDGRSSIRLAASNFLPLVAGVPGTAQAARMVDVLRDERRFWGAYLVPTISRDDPAFADQQYWRGAIWPPINYLVYHGLRRYGFDAVAAELAASSARIFLDSWTRYQLCRENYDSRTGVGGGHRHQSWGPLLALMGAEELITVTPWDGLRFGSGAPPWSRMPGRDAEAAGAVEALRGVRVAGSRWNVIRSLDGLAIEVNDRRVLTIPGGAVARHVTYEDGVFSARLTFLEDAVVEFGTPNDDPIVTLGGEPVSIVERRLRVGPGTHALQVRLG